MDFIAPINKPHQSSTPSEGAERQLPPLPYTPPEWSESCPRHFSIQIIKSGVVLRQVELLNKEYLVLGRLPNCDIDAEHPSISRYHAIVQYRNDCSVHLYDLASSHGTYLNKTRLHPRTYYKLNSGDFIRLGESSRLYVFCRDDDNDVATGTIALEPTKHDSKTQSEMTETPEISWGFKDDAKEEEFEPNASAAYLQDPKKHLKQWCDEANVKFNTIYEKEKIEDEVVFLCKIVTDFHLPSGKKLVGVGSGSSRKEAERDASADACSHLERIGEFQDEGSSKKGTDFKLLKETLNNEERDEFFDRTLTKKPRLDREAPSSSKPETLESCLVKKARIDTQIKEFLDKINELEALETSQGTFEDELDAYMNKVQDSMKLQEKSRIQKELNVLQKELERIEKLLLVLKPTDSHIASSASSTAALVSTVTGTLVQSVDKKELVALNNHDSETDDTSISNSEKNGSHSLSVKQEVSTPLKLESKMKSERSDFQLPAKTRSNTTPQPQSTVQYHFETEEDIVDCTMKRK